ncbi:GntR family transcriptional regulator [Microlunatus sp. Y2014]|uniref:GntR family transcriptional regulator n=1 Tax=Microlunatus sp. Y2014 TaxID=3418488 RepID=UPI003DA6F478
MTKKALARGTALPLQSQLLAELRKDLSRHAVGARLPTEVELTERYQVSRTTVRNAIQVLVDEGRVVRQQGRGSFVAEPRISRPLDKVWALVESFTAHDLDPESSLRAFDWIDADDAERLGLPEVTLPPTGALHVQRVYRVHAAPVAVADAYLPGEIGQQITRADVEAHPTFQVIEDKFGPILHHARLTVRSRAATEQVAALLDVEVGTPLLVLHRWLHRDDDRLAQFVVYHLVAELFEFTLEPQVDPPHALSHAFTGPRPVLTLRGSTD